MQSITPRVARCLAVLACLCSSVFVLAQGTGGRITGRVTDSTDAVLAQVKVTLVNEATGVSRDAQTNESGDYSFIAVPVGTYRLEFDLTGFKKNVRKGVALDLNQVITLNMVMQIGETKEVVEVTSEAPLVDTTSTQLGTVVNDRAVVQLPLNQRDTYQFLSLQPGVQSQVGADLYVGSDNAGSVSVNGGRGRANNFNVNGGDANDMFANLPTVQPSPDTVEEFRILTNTFDAEYGRNSGSVVNVVTKSGTNQFHGNVYEFLRNKVLNAQGFFDTSKASFIQNQFGGTLGGPIKKDRTFFFGSYEGRRVRQGQSGDRVTVPTAGERNGVFAGSFDGTIQDRFVAQVLQGRPGCENAINAGGGSIPDPTDLGNYGTNPIPWSTLFPTVGGSTSIPIECQDPVAVDLLNRYVPQANIAGGLFQAVLSSRERQDQSTVRFDHRINDKQNFSAYYYFTDEDIFHPFNNFQAAGANIPGFGASIKQRFQQYNLSHTWTLRSDLVNEFHFTYMREAQRTNGHSEHTNLVTNSCSASLASICFTGVSDSSAINNLDLQRLGIQPGLGPTREGVPDISVSGGFTIGNNFEGELPQVGNSFQWSDNITKTKGNHTFKFGADVRRMRFDQTLYFEVSGYHQYFGGGTNDPAFAGDLYPNYLLGLVDQYQQGAAQVENVRTTSTYLFGQDSWKIRPNLTLNYGLRWELNTPLTDIGHHVQTFRPGQTTTTYPCQLSAYGSTLLGGSTDCTQVFPTGLVVPGDKGIPAGLTQTYYKSFAPRIGIAWSPGKSGKTSFRAGWGMFYNPIEQLVLEQFSAEPPFGGSTLTFNTFFNTPFMAQGGFQNPNPFNPEGGALTGIQNPKPGQPVDWSIFRPLLLFGEFPKNMRSQYSEQYNFTIQRELTNDMVLQLSYVGSQGHRLLATTDLNAGNPQTCLDIAAIDGSCGVFGEDTAYNITVPEGMVFHLPNRSTITGATGGTPITLVGLRPFSSPNCDPMTGTNCPADGIPVFTNIFQQNTFANSSYNSFQANLEKRFSHGLQLQGAYTYSKSLDMASSFEDIINPFNPAVSRSLSLFDARQRFVLSYYYELPVPKYSGAKGKLLNGWAVSGITQFQSGFPIHIQSFNDTELTGSIDFSAAGTPQQVAPLKILNPKKNGGYYFDPASFTDAPLGQFGNTKRTICCGPGLNNSDISLQKDTQFNERTKMEFRWDIFNLANHPKLFNPNGNITDGTEFGRIARAGDPRLMQFALKLYF